MGILHTPRLDGVKEKLASENAFLDVYGCADGFEMF